MTDIRMPQLSDAMEEGTILTWLRNAGEDIEVGDELVEIETDKATMTYESPEAGVLEIVVAEGTTTPVGQVIARVAAPGSRAAAPGVDGAPAAASPGAGAPDGSDARSPEPDRSSPPEDSDTAPTRATPLARRLARAHGVDLATLQGTGPDGRIRRADVERAAGLQPAPARGSAVAAVDPVSRPAAATADPAKGAVIRVELSRLQSTIARRMSEAKATVPEFQVEVEVALDAALELRAQLKEQGGERAPSLNDLVIKASALALREHPRANGSFRDGALELYERINVGMAVAAEDALVVPTVFDADRLSLGAIATETRRLAARVRSGEIGAGELEGATFTVSNLGMYGMSAITPVINPPHAAIVGVGATRVVTVLVDGEPRERRVLTLRMTCDHRILYGAHAAEFLATIQRRLENPLTLLL
jgi:pyruvate dehydrogenase E2 component (dihydrolipoamide acetyltransferase)